MPIHALGDLPVLGELVLLKVYYPNLKQRDQICFRGWGLNCFRDIRVCRIVSAWVCLQVSSCV